MKNIKKIVVLGPESTGKSTLCASLAKHYHTNWCAEYAREYLIKNGSGYHYDDLLQIAKGQVALEEESIVAARRKDKALIFLDTDMYVMKVWCEFVYNKCHAYILEQIAEREYDLYLLCNTDLPWIPDELREYPDERSRRELFCIYYDILVQQKIPFAIISGENEQRISDAIKNVETLLFR